MTGEPRRPTAVPLDLDSLKRRLRQRLGRDVRELQPLLQGASSHTLRAVLVSPTGATTAVVVKVAPPGLPPVGNRDVLRQAAMLRQLSASEAVPVPEVLTEDAGAPPDVPPLFVMSYVPGDTFEPLFDQPDPKGVATETTDVIQRGHAAATILAQLHTVPTATPDLGNEPVLSPTSEVQRWADALASVTEPAVPNWPQCRDELLASTPTMVRPVISHGDFRLGNMIAVGSTIKAVIDWEIWALADPRVDLAWLRLNGDPSAYRRMSRYADIFPSPDDLLASYSGAATVDVTEMRWFDAAARFKAAAIWALILKRARRVGDGRFDDVASVLGGLVATSRSLLR